MLLLFWGTSQSKVALANARDLSGSRERMPKSTLSLPKCCCLFITVAGHFNQFLTVSGSSLHLLHNAHRRCLLVDPIRIVSQLLAVP